MKGINRINNVNITIVVFTILMLVLSTFCSLILHNSTLYNVISSKLTYLVEIDDAIGTDSLHILEQKLLKERIKDLKLIDKEEAVSLMVTELALLNSDENFENPFKNHFSFNFSSEQSTEEVKLVVDRISDYEYVNGVFYNQILIDNVKSAMNILSLVLLICTIFLVIVNFTFIYNILKILMISKHKEIKTMQLVGAKSRFIKHPFITDITKISYIAALLHLIILVVILILVSFKYPVIFDFIELKYIVISIIIVVGLSVMLSKLFTNIILNKLLLKRLYER